MCHQTVCLVANHLEQSGIPTVVLGAALDILEAGRPPRAIFVDYPLGHSSGRPDDPADQLGIVRAAVEAFARIAVPGTILRLPNRWGPDEAWKAKATDTAAGDSRRPRDTTPQYQTADDRIAAEERQVRGMHR